LLGRRASSPSNGAALAALYGAVASQDIESWVMADFYEIDFLQVHSARSGDAMSAAYSSWRNR
jgi:hypothetical protein